jgi:hypothetical protein
MNFGASSPESASYGDFICRQCRCHPAAPNCCEPAPLTEPRAAREAKMATLVPSRSARRVELLVGDGNIGALTDADFQGCRWDRGRAETPSTRHVLWPSGAGWRELVR